MSQVLKLDPTFKSAEVGTTNAEALKKAEENREIQDGQPADSKEDIIEKYNKEFQLPSERRSRFFLDYEKEACIAANVPIVQIPDSVIYQLTQLICQEDNSSYIDLVQNVNPHQQKLDLLTSQLEEKNALMAKYRMELSAALQAIVDLQNQRVQQAVQQATQQILQEQKILPITLPNETMRTLTSNETALLTNANQSLTLANTLNDAEYATKLTQLRDKITAISDKINATNNDRIDIQSNLVIEQTKALSFIAATPPKLLSGDEIISKYMFGIGI
jgi:putative ubiquitin-RnfH superfamily antitoxin RatB of RatAB toxin-antitoxin module